MLFVYKAKNHALASFIHCYWNSLSGHSKSGGQGRSLAPVGQLAASNTDLPFFALHNFLKHLRAS